MRHLIFVFVLYLVGTPAHGQEALVGRQVWVRSTGPSGGLDAGVKGTVEGFAGDSLHLHAPEGGAAFSIRVGPGDQLFVLSGRQSSIGRSALIGTTVGVGVGVVLGVVGGEDCSSSDWMCFDRGTMAMGLGLALGAVGLVGGLIVGAVRQHDTWERATWLGTVRPVVRTSPGGFGVGLSTKF
jgi:hypothetical protein